MAVFVLRVFDFLNTRARGVIARYLLSFKLNATLENALIWIIVLGAYAALLTPLVVSPGFLYPFVSPKGIFFWIFAEIVFAAYLLLALYNKKYRPRENLLLYAIFGFVLIMALASFRGVNPTLSIWSTFERMSGLIMLVHGFLLFLALFSTFRKFQDWKKFLTASVFVGAATATVFFLDDYLGSALPEARLGSTLGNSSFFGAYIIFPLFFSLLLLLKERGIFKKIFFTAAFALMSSALLFSHAVGATFAFVGGLTLIFSVWLYFNKFSFIRSSIRPLALKFSWSALALFIIFGASLSYGVLAQKESITKYSPVYYVASGIEARKIVWKSAWEGFLERPILGWGPENFRAAFSGHFNPCLYLGNECGGEVWFDRAHNIVFDTLVAGGAVGMLSYLLIFVAAVYLLWKALITSKNWLLPSVIMALLAAYFAQNLFVFDMPASYVMFFFTLAFAGGLTNKKFKKDNSTDKHPDISVFKDSAVVVLLVLSISLYFFGYRSLQDANYAARSLKIRLQLEERIDAYTASLAATPLSNEQVRQQFLRAMTAWLQNDADIPPDAFEKSKEEAQTLLKENPYSLRSHLIVGDYYNAIAEQSINDLKDKKRADEYLERGKKALTRAYELAPRHHDVYLSLAQNFIYRRDLQKAEELLNMAIDIEPRYANAHWNLGDLYLMRKQYDKAAGKFDDAQALGYLPNTLGKLSTLAQGYAEAGRYDKAAFWYEKIVAIKERDPEAHWTLAIFYKELGDQEKAKQEALKVKELDGQYEYVVDNFIKGLE